MAFDAWPSTGLLGALAQSGSWQLTPRPEVRRSDYDVGPENALTRMDRVVYDATYTVLMTTAEMAALRTFYYHTIHAGVDRFLMPVWDGETYSTCQVQFAEPYSASYHSPDAMLVTIPLTVWDLPVMDDAAVWMVMTYGGDFTVTFSNALHVEVHTHYPSAYPIPSAVTGPGDLISPTVAWWGLRAFKYTRRGIPHIKLRRDSDNTTADFSPLLHDGSMDVTAIAAFKGGANLFVDTLYDQTGNAHHMVQATLARQPALILAGLGTQPIMLHTAASTQYLASNLANQPQTKTMACVAKLATLLATQQGALVGEFNGHGFFTSGGGNDVFLYDGGTIIDVSGAADGNFHSYVGLMNGASSNLRVDDTDHLGTVGVGATADNYAMSNGLVPLQGAIQEGGIWGFGFSAAQQAIMSANAKNYWGF